jgi:hypothetical protein
MHLHEPSPTSQKKSVPGLAVQLPTPLLQIMFAVPASSQRRMARLMARAKALSLVFSLELSPMALIGPAVRQLRLHQLPTCDSP